MCVHVQHRIQGPGIVHADSLSHCYDFLRQVNRRETFFLMILVTTVLSRHCQILMLRSEAKCFHPTEK